MGGNADESGRGEKGKKPNADEKNKEIWEKKIWPCFASNVEGMSKSKENNSSSANTGINTNLESEQKTDEVTITSGLTNYNTGGNYNDGLKQETGSIKAGSKRSGEDNNPDTGQKKKIPKEDTSATFIESSEYINEQFSSNVQQGLLDSLKTKSRITNTGMNINMQEEQKTGDIGTTSTPTDFKDTKCNYDHQNRGKQVIGSEGSI